MAPAMGTTDGTYITGRAEGVRSLLLPGSSTQVKWSSRAFSVTSFNNRVAVSYFLTSFLPALGCTGSFRIEAKSEIRGKCYLPDISNLTLVPSGLVAGVNISKRCLPLI